LARVFVDPEPFAVGKDDAAVDAIALVNAVLPVIVHSPEVWKTADTSR
jgi:hypothetical protein